MCEYCEGKEDISNKIFEDGSKFSDYMVRVWIDKLFEVLEIDKKLIDIYLEPVIKYKLKEDK